MTFAVIEGVALTPVRRKHDAPTSTAVVHRSARGDRTSCQAQMMLARIVPAFSGTDLHTFECTLCNHVLKKLGACEDWRGPRRC
jgi:hypothetical protein